MAASGDLAGLEVGFDIPALPGMALAEVQTPCLIVDLDALERNIVKLGDFARAEGIRLRPHGKMHKSVDVAKLQIARGQACGICCQKVSEAEAFVRGGIMDVLISNEVRDPVKIDRMARLPKLGARIICCVDDIDNVAALSEAAGRHGTRIECLVEVDCGQGRCGVLTPQEAVVIAKAVDAAPNLHFAGIQAYHGGLQHVEDFADREEAFNHVAALVRKAIAALGQEGLTCDIIGGGGTGSYRLEASSGLYNELQCGSYAFMDADYGRVRDHDGKALSDGEWAHALFLLTSVMSLAKPDKAVVDAGLKSQSVDSGLPRIHGRNDITFALCTDEHGEIADPEGVLRINERLRLVPGHCDPTVNLHDWLVGVRNDRVEVLWPVTARGKSF